MIEQAINAAGNIAGKGIDAHANIKTEKIKSGTTIAGKSIDSATSIANKATDACQITKEDIDLVNAYTEKFRNWIETVQNSEQFTDEEKFEKFEKIFDVLLRHEDRAEKSRLRKIVEIAKVAGVACATVALAGMLIFILKKPLSVASVPGFLLNPAGRFLKNLII